MMDVLIQQLETKGPALSVRVLDEQYKNPFWMERFGERGRKYAEEDSAYHLSYLVQALAAEDPGILTKYARWLQTVLTSRGMCTRHLDENFELLAKAITGELSGSRMAVAYLEQARAALRYAAGPARELQDVVVAELGAEAGYLLSHLSDAVALGKPEQFAEHVGWVDRLARRRGDSPEALRALLRALSQRLPGEQGLSAEARAAAAQVLAAGQARVARRGPEEAP